MKKFTLLDIALLFLLSMASVLCVGVTSAIGADETVTEIQGMENTREVGTMKRENREEPREAFTRTIQDRIINLAGNVTARLTAIFERLNTISTRLESRMQKLEEMGVNTQTARAKLAEANTMIRAGIDALSRTSSVSEAIRGNTPRESFARIRTQFTEIREMARQSYGLLKETVTLLKEAVRASESARGVSDAVRTEQKIPATTE